MKSSDFKGSFQNLIYAGRSFMELTKAEDAAEKSGSDVDFDDSAYLTQCHERPDEYIQAFLDVIRVEFEPNLLGTFFLNANSCFIYNSATGDKLKLGYISIISQDDQEFNDFWRNSAVPHIHKCGYDIYGVMALFAVVTTGEERYWGNLPGDVLDILNAGFTIEEVLNRFSKALATDSDPGLRTNSNTYAGFCLDPALGSKLRLSLWFFYENKIFNQ